MRSFSTGSFTSPVPLMAAAILLAAYELRSGVAAPIRRAAVAVSPLLLATLTFIAGAWLSSQA